jgi:hypothetical protein
MGSIASTVLERHYVTASYNLRLLTLSITRSYRNLCNVSKKYCHRCINIEISESSFVQFKINQLLFFSQHFAFFYIDFMTCLNSSFLLLSRTSVSTVYKGNEQINTVGIQRKKEHSYKPSTPNNEKKMK